MQHVEMDFIKAEKTCRFFTIRLHDKAERFQDDSSHDVLRKCLFFLYAKLKRMLSRITETQCAIRSISKNNSTFLNCEDFQLDMIDFSRIVVIFYRKPDDTCNIKYRNILKYKPKKYINILYYHKVFHNVEAANFNIERIE